MTVNPNNLLMGPAKIGHGIFGVTEPTNASAAWAAGITDLGATDGGATLRLGQTYTPMTVDQTTMAVGSRLTAQEVAVTTSLAEGTLDNLRRSLNALPDLATEFEFGGALTGNEEPNYSAVFLLGQKPGGGPRLIVVRRALSTENVELAWTKDGKTMIPVTFTGYFVSESILAVRVDDTTV